jgi:hypothetical protein
VTLNKSDSWECPKGLERKAYENILGFDLQSCPRISRDRCARKKKEQKPAPKKPAQTRQDNTRSVAEKSALNFSNAFFCTQNIMYTAIPCCPHPNFPENTGKHLSLGVE